MVWEPINLNEVCQPYNQLAACSYFGYVYLNLIADLFGDSIDRRIQEKLGIKEDVGPSFDTYHLNSGRHIFNGIETDKVIRDGYEKTDYNKEKNEYDFIVVGAGSAGCVVTNRLVNKNYRVLLLEAGNEQPDITLIPGLSVSILGSNIDWNYFTEPNGKSCLGRDGQKCSWPRGKTMGGTSSINSMSYIRGSKVDYDDWAAMGNEGWSYKDVLPFFIKSENNLNIHSLDKGYHGYGGEQSISQLPYIDRPSFMMTKAFMERGLPLADFNGVNQFATMQGQTFTRYGERVSTNTAFIQPIRYKRKNLTVQIKSEVIQILIDGNKRAYGVAYVKNGKIYTAVAQNEVIISGGTINSPQLLMLSGIGPKDHLESVGIRVLVDSHVGYNLHDHVTFNGYAIALPKENSTLVDKKTIIKDILDYKMSEVKNGPISGNGAVNSLAFFKTEPGLKAVDVQYQCDQVVLEEYLSNPALYESISTFPTAYYDAIITRTKNLVPKSRGRILLNSTDPRGYPIIHANYFDNELDLIPLIKGVRFILSLENTKAFQDMGAHYSREKMPGCKQYEWGTDDYTICLARTYTASTYHLVGTCKMGPKEDKTAVVDPRLRVYGVSRLRVIDASIMPVVVRGNTNAPSIMIGEKGVDMLLEDWEVKNTKYVRNDDS